ncbi:hypothetical protein [Streptomyces sp. NPDC020817]|uniref:hypothetical protein n=1 Tax=Streptomyces sp. NPDC020817 TaxID=3365095 RepID=UPI00379F70E0
MGGVPEGDVVRSVGRFAEGLRGRVSYHYGRTTWIRAVALDRRHPAPHLHLVYYLPIEDAYAHGINALHAGMTTIEAKRRRGAEVSGLYALVDQDPKVRHPGGGDGGGPKAI